jgi:hypothetical protein
MSDNLAIRLQNVAPLLYVPTHAIVLGANDQPICSISVPTRPCRGELELVIGKEAEWR